MSNLDVCFDANNIVGESPFWNEYDSTINWIDIIGKKVCKYSISTKKYHEWTYDEFVCGLIPISANKVAVALTHDLIELNVTTGDSLPIITLEKMQPDNRINEVKCDPSGRLWVGTMKNNIKADGSPKDLDASTGSLYRIDSRDCINTIESNIGISNTLAWDSESNFFYFADSVANKIWQYHYNAETGGVDKKTTFASTLLAGSPDGSAIDISGNLWNARFGDGAVICINKEGDVIKKILLPVTNPTSCAFGGENYDTLFVTSATFSLSHEQLAKNPLEGSVIAIKVGAIGVPGTSWKFDF
ncbi:MAG: SMP-30/gluconolactonase/LRE family protein [Planktomarina sp.]|nr:SMP-30/gluconolactonase/LRE family protein [Planktomarina sp.]